MIGVTDNILFITVSTFFLFCALPLVNTSAEVVVRKNIANETQGRAWGIIGVLSHAGFIAAYITAGFLADRVFNPLFSNDGALASTIGEVIGTGPGINPGASRPERFLKVISNEKFFIKIPERSRASPAML